MQDEGVSVSFASGEYHCGRCRDVCCTCNRAQQLFELFVGSAGDGVIALVVVKRGCIGYAWCDWLLNGTEPGR